ncbi:MAG: YbaK/EbsC family protein, partial [Thermoanaerobaculia bacterium]
MDAVTGSGRSAAVQEAIERLLVEADVAYRILRHDPVRTAEDAAAARGLPLSHGVKTLVLRVDDGFLLLALPADLSLSSRALRRGL